MELHLEHSHVKCALSFFKSVTISLAKEGSELGEIYQTRHSINLHVTVLQMYDFKLLKTSKKLKLLPV